MADALIVCGGQSAPSKKAKTIIRLDVSPNADPAHRIDFDAAKMRAKFVDELPDVVADALELAVYVFAADRVVKRGSSRSPEIGSDWQRRLQFQVPVRRPEVWRRRDLNDALVDVLTFLSGDDLSFEFQQARDARSPEPFLGFGDPAAHVIRPDLVMLFSGGLDSLAGVATEVIGAGKSAVLVTHQIIWDKTRLVIGRGDYHWQHEPAFYAVKKGRKGHWAGDRKQTTVWAIPHRKSPTGHGTEKPVECMRRPIENNSSPGQAVYEPFSGSGTTIIAAEMTGRCCHAVELNPAYVDLAITRWQDFTGQAAVHAEIGATFADVRAQRAVEGHRNG